jgi:esterase/lipase superfamily enzyme
VRLAFVAFLLTFIISRVWAILTMTRRMPDLLSLGGGIHVHHLIYGICLLPIAAALLFFYPAPRGKRGLWAALYGVAMGLASDAFGMWLNAGGSYWERASFDAVVVLLAAFGLIAFAPRREGVRSRHFLTVGALLMVVASFYFALFNSFHHANEMLMPSLIEIEESGPRESVNLGKEVPEHTPPSEDGFLLEEEKPELVEKKPTPLPSGVPVPRNAQELGTVTLYYATDRVWTGSKEQPRWFGHDWNEEGGHLSYGRCEVSIPLATHTPGEVEKPAWYRLEFFENPKKHVVLYRPQQLAEKIFFNDLAQAVRERDEKEVMIFIHGFNNTFDDAASRLGVLAFDMQFAGVPVLYSWSSQGETLSYAHDEEACKNTIRPLTNFLAAVAQTGRDAGARRINVVAHSMGNRPLVAAMQALAARTDGQVLFEEVVMAAPDVPATGFATDEWPLMHGTVAPAKRVTLYASSDDKALKASKKVHGYRRIGEGGDGLLLLPGLDTIDATGCDFSWFGLNHTYFGGPHVISDLRTLFREGLAPAERKLRPMKRMELPYWLLPNVASK